MSYPERGHLVDVVEGGTIWIPEGIAWRPTSILQGGVRHVLGVVPEWDTPERSERPGVWVNMKPGTTGRMGILSPSSWWPVEGPPLPESLNRVQR